MNYQDFCGNESMLPTPYIRVVTKIRKVEKYECIEINGFMVAILKIPNQTYLNIKKLIIVAFSGHS